MVCLYIKRINRHRNTVTLEAVLETSKLIGAIFQKRTAGICKYHYCKVVGTLVIIAFLAGFIFKIFELRIT